jgi:hypothetical protein
VDRGFLERCGVPSLREVTKRESRTRTDPPLCLRDIGDGLSNPRCGFLVEEPGRLQRAVTGPVVEQEGDSVIEGLPKQPEDSLGPVARAAQGHTPFGDGIALIASSWETNKLQSPNSSRLRVDSTSPGTTDSSCALAGLPRSE